VTSGDVPGLGRYGAEVPRKEDLYRAGKSALVALLVNAADQVTQLLVWMLGNEGYPDFGPANRDTETPSAA